MVFRPKSWKDCQKRLKETEAKRATTRERGNSVRESFGSGGKERRAWVNSMRIHLAQEKPKNRRLVGMILGSGKVWTVKSIIPFPFWSVTVFKECSDTPLWLLDVNWQVIFERQIDRRKAGGSEARLMSSGLDFSSVWLMLATGIWPSSCLSFLLLLKYFAIIICWNYLRAF